MMIFPSDMNKPDCFPSVEMYVSWIRLCRIVKEVAVICDDCTPEYKSEMKAAGKCTEMWQRQNNVFGQRNRSNENDLFSEIFSGTDNRP